VIETWARWRNDFAVLAEQFQKGCSRVDGLEAMEQQDWAACAAPHGFELDSTDREPLAIPVPKRHRIPSLAKPNWRCIASIAARSKTEVRVVISRRPGGGPGPITGMDTGFAGVTNTRGI
jgi:hypothetical protein